MDWYQIDVTEIDTPALIIDQKSVAENIEKALQHAGGADRLRPHVKTHKTLEVARMQCAAGIYKFKCATIPEAEMLGMAGAHDVLIAYQPHGPKVDRVKKLIEQYPDTHFSVLVDNKLTAKRLNETFQGKHPLSVYIDINDGQNRTGIVPEESFELFEQIKDLPGLTLGGLHCYDGHIRMSSLNERIQASTEAFEKVISLRQRIEEHTGHPVNMVAGGSPSFSVHASYHDAECSPGTFIFWDERYQRDYAELPFVKAAVVATRVLSKIDAYTYCLDLGHKSIASEFPFPRVHLISAHTFEQIGHSEEHLVIKSSEADVLEVGEILFGYPYHICPTVALYDHFHVVDNGKIVDQWKVIARDRKISV